MAAVSTGLKCVLSLVVVCGILYVLITPLPEVNATFSGKSALSFFVLVTHALLSPLFYILVLGFRPVRSIAALHDDVLQLTCVRLC